MKLLADAVGADAVVEDVGFSPGELKAALPAATYASFALDCADVLGNRVLFASPTAGVKPAALAAQLRRISQAAGCDAACALDDPSPYLKKRLMAEGSGFVTNRGEFFLPALLHLKPVREKKPVAAESELKVELPAAIAGVVRRFLDEVELPPHFTKDVGLSAFSPEELKGIVSRTYL